MPLTLAFARALPLAFAMAVVAGPASTLAANLEPVELLVEQTGATLTRAHNPLVFAHERSSLAGSARDYISLTAVAIDRVGSIQTYLVGYFWSTNDRRNLSSETALSDKPLDLLADGREITLTPAAELPDELRSQPRFVQPPVSRARRAVYPASPELLKTMAAAKSLALSKPADNPPADAAPTSYALWDDGGNALAAFVSRAAGFK